MALSYDLLSQFAKIVNTKQKTSTESTVYGKVVEAEDGSKYVQPDGSDQLIPLGDANVDSKKDDRVSVLIKDHTATVTGNMSSPATSITTVKDIENILAGKIQANEAYIKELDADKIGVGELDAAKAEIENLYAKKATVEELSADVAEVTELTAKKLDAEAADLKYATIKNLEATDAKVGTLEAAYGEFEKIVTEDLTAQNAEIANLKAKDAEIDELVAKKASIEDLNAVNAEITNLKAKDADIESLIAGKADVEDLEATNAEIKNLSATKADISSLEAITADIEKLDAKDAEIENLVAGKADVEELNATNAAIENLGTKYANIDFANIGEAAIKKIFSDTGLIKDLTVGDHTVTGELVGVTIKGDLIEGNTVKADKLVVKGSDGIYYKLNFEAGTFADGEAVPDDGLHGSVITANSITAEKISVKDLVAFGATIGGFQITDSAIHSHAKESVDSTVEGIYMDSEGQFSIGDSNNFLKYYKDADGTYKLAISAGSISFSSSNKSVDEVVSEAIDTANAAKETADKAVLEATVNLRIDSSRGTVFKNNTVSTVLSAVIYKGSKRITDIEALHAEFGASAYLEWLWQRIGEETFGTILSTDSRIGNGGFTFTLSPEDVDTKVVFMCQLITD